MNDRDRSLGLLRLLCCTLEHIPDEILVELAYDDQWAVLYQRYVTRSSDLHTGWVGEVRDGSKVN